MTSPSDPLDFPHGPSWRNRLALAPMTNKQSHPDGTLSDDEIQWLLARARHGFGMVMTAAAYVDPAGKAWQGQLGVSDEAHLPGLTRLAEGIRDAGAASVVQLHHGGMRSNPEVSGHAAVAPFDDAETGARALTTDEIHATVESFARAAALTERAGFDGVQLHGAHGYLLSQFLDTHNLRTDGYGGGLNERARIIRETIAAVRAATSASFHVGIRLSVERLGLDTSEMLQLVGELLLEGELDHIDVSLWDAAKMPEDALGSGERLVDIFTALPRGATRLGIAGKIPDGLSAQEALATGADFINVGRAAVADERVAERLLADPTHRGPDFPVTKQHLRENHLGEAFVTYFSMGWPHLVDG